MLRGTAYGAALFAAGGVIPALTACGAAGKSAEQKTAEELVPFAQSALADADDAQSLIATNPDRTAALTVIADERRIHARLLEEEIARLHPDDYSASPSPSAPTGSPAQPDIDSFRTRLSTQARTTADLAVTQNGYVAGLLGSISVALDCAAKVQLP